LALSVVAGGDSQSTGIDAYVAEHAALAAGLDAALETALAPGATRNDRAGLVLFLRVDLLPHAAAEEAILYPAVERVLGTRGYATATLVLDHRKVSRIADDLATLAAAGDVAGFGRAAVALGAFFAYHFDREEEFVLPTLADRLPTRELNALLARMHPTTTME
jgi:hypothetical protein